MKIRHLIIATLLGLVTLLIIAMSAENVSDLNKNIEQIEYDLLNQNTSSLKIYTQYFENRKKRGKLMPKIKSAKHRLK